MLPFEIVLVLGQAASKEPEGNNAVIAVCNPQLRALTAAESRLNTSDYRPGTLVREAQPSHGFQMCDKLSHDVKRLSCVPGIASSFLSEEALKSLSIFVYTHQAKTVSRHHSGIDIRKKKKRERRRSKKLKHCRVVINTYFVTKIESTHLYPVTSGFLFTSGFSDRFYCVWF